MSLTPQIRADHRWVLHHRRWISLGEQTTLVEHHDAGGELVYHPEKMLDQDDLHSRAVDSTDHRHRVIDLDRVQARQRFVEQEDPGAGGHRPCHLE